jgi:hypothetical protein
MVLVRMIWEPAMASEGAMEIDWDVEERGAVNGREVLVLLQVEGFWLP